MKNKKIYALVLACFIGLIACKKEDDLTKDNNGSTPDPTGVESIDDFVDMFVPPIVGPEIVSPEVQGSINSWSEDGSQYCTTKEYKWGPHFSEGFLLEPSSDVIFPGAILDGNSISSGGYTLLSLDRTGGTLSAQQLQVANTSATVEKTVKSQVQQAITTMVSQPQTGGTSAAITFKTTEVDTRKQFDIATQLKIGIREKLNVDAAFDYNSDRQVNRFLLEFQQVYYEISYDPKSSPAEYFGPDVVPSDLEKFIDGNIAPVYVSNVKYGRLAYFAVTTELSSSAFQAALNLDATGATWDASTQTTVSNTLNEANTTITGTIVGGSASDAVQALTGVDGIIDFITNGGDFSPESPGSPIAYKLSSLSDNSIFTIQTVDSYVIQECKSIEGAIELVAMAHVAGSDDSRIEGTVSYQLGYDDGLTASETDLLTASNRITLVRNGTKIEGSTAFTGNSNLAYDPQRFDQAYIQINVDLNNEACWTLGTRHQRNGCLYSRINDSYRIKLSSLVNPNTLSNEWSTQDGETFNLKLKFPEVKENKGFCDRTGRIGCQSSDGNNNSADVFRKASDVSLSFLINAVDITLE